ncbi:hypothetical protein GCM10028895_39790 [Pontibacter rugosus]
MSQLTDKIKQLAQAYGPDTVQVRRHIHANPELSFEEYNTAAYVKQVLEEYGIAAEYSYYRFSCYGKRQES